MNDVVRAWLESAEKDLENVRIVAGNDFVTPVKGFSEGVKKGGRILQIST